MNVSRRRFLQFAGTTFAVFATSPAAVFAKPKKLIVDMAPRLQHKPFMIYLGTPRHQNDLFEKFYTVPKGQTFHTQAISVEEGPFFAGPGQFVAPVQVVTPHELAVMYRRNSGKMSTVDAALMRGEIRIEHPKAIREFEKNERARLSDSPWNVLCTGSRK